MPTEPKPRKRPRISAQRIIGQPLFMQPNALKVWAESVTKPAAGFYDDDDEDDETKKPYEMAGNVACISICRPLTKAAYWRTQSYSEIGAAYSQAMNDPAVKGILLRFDSPGGEVSGLFDCADHLYSLKSTKPVAAISDDMCYSAAYCLASVADQMFVTRTGGTGSVGCWMAHADYSKMLDAEGIKVTLIAAGERKVDRNPYEPLSAEAEADMQDGVDRIRQLFVDTVARNRSISVEALMDTEAACYMAEDGVPLLADAVGSCADALAYLNARIAATDDEGDIIDNLGSVAGAGVSISRSPILSGRMGFNAERVISGSEAFAVIGEQRRDVIAAVRNSPRAKATISKRSTGSQRKIEMLIAPVDDLARLDAQTFERYAPGCWSQGLSSDPRILFCHLEQYVLGRQSSGTARFWEDSEGLHAEVDVPSTQWAADLCVSVQRLDITQCSAAFFITKSRWENGPGPGQRTRVLEKCVLREGSIHSFPAYTQTSATISDPLAAEYAALAAIRGGPTSELSQAVRELARLSR